ncbi:MAG: hypothetical protein SV775_15410, partial [Thermodesulfobacteriota bacterium]|nr:hypothetical protein [Thermodesulfobacteriota bacterium]
MKELDLEKAAFIIYLIVLVLSPLLFGAVHAYVYTIMTIGVLAASLLLVIKNTGKNLRSGIYEFKLPSTSLDFTFLVILVFLLFQCIPIPAFLLRLLSSEAGVVGQKSLPASMVVIQDKWCDAWFSLSPYYYPVRMSIIKWSVYGLFFLGLTQVLNSQKRIEWAVSLILI